MDRESFRAWLDSYGRAWMGRDPVAAAGLYADDATHQVTPFSEPLRGREAIYEYWDGVTKTEERIQFDCEVVAVTAEHGIARWWASFVRVPPGLETKLDGTFVVSLDSNGRCQSLREWWHKLQ
ncbi:MAG TPA: nuclear transport factor 2 family protein [Candidatus Acidoferrum sp.]|nr:nuclear transport factor 2 family protein [Candidatus Acidoferrum sp.]